MVSVNGGTEENVASRIKKVTGVFVQLYPVWWFCMGVKPGR